jgi:endonuclease/exonuclease/phosphatase family metal-dependent hydrolase
MNDASAGGEPRPAERYARVRVLSYNVRSLRDDRAALLRVIKACEPDLVCVQEAPRFLRWRTRCALFAADLGLFVVSGGADASGNLLLSSLRVDVERAGVHELRRRRDQYRRGAAYAVVRVGGARLALVGTHLSLDAGQRRAQADELLGLLDQLGAPARVLCGDFNETPDGAAWQRLAGQLTDSWAAAAADPRTEPRRGELTSGSARPYKRIDGVFASRDIRVRAAGVPLDLVAEHDLAIATDHRPVLADLSVPLP